MRLEFADWLTKNETTTSTSCIAGFARPVSGLYARAWPGLLFAEEDPFFSKKKKKQERYEEGAMQVYKKIPEGVIKINLPNVQQQTSYSCGAACCHSVCAYFGVGPDDQEEYIKKLGTDPKNGTEPTNMVDFLRSYGLFARPINEMSVQQLKDYIDQEKPVICALQAWGTKKDYKKGTSGHYVVAIGYDSRNLYFEDPSSTGLRTFLPIKDFQDRWFDYDIDGNELTQFGIVVWKRGKTQVAKFMK